MEMQMGWTTPLWSALSLAQGPDRMLVCFLQTVRQKSLETLQAEVNLVLVHLPVPLPYWIHHGRRTWWRFQSNHYCQQSLNWDFGGGGTTTKPLR